MSVIPGTYRIVSLQFESETPMRLLDLKGANPDPGTPILCYPDHDGTNQRWIVGPAEEGEDYYNFQAVTPLSNIFINSGSITGDPNNKTALKLQAAGGENQFSIWTNVNDTELVFQASGDINAPVTLEPFTNTSNQIWLFFVQFI